MDDGLEPWQRMFHDRWQREAEKRAASVPDPADDDLWMEQAYEDLSALDDNEEEN